MEITYTQVGNVQIPNLVLDPQPEDSIGKYGRMRKRYLEQKHDGTYTALVLSGRLTDHLIETNEIATEEMDSLICKMAKAEGVTEDLKRRDQMAWVGAMNIIRNRADEIVRNELVYV